MFERKRGRGKKKRKKNAHRNSDTVNGAIFLYFITMFHFGETNPIKYR